MLERRAPAGGGARMAGGGMPPPQELADEAAGEGRSALEPKKATPESKLAGTLAGLAERVQREGRDGDLTDGSLRVTKFQGDVMVYLRDLSDETRKLLEALGFKQSAESNATRLLIGTIDVRKLLDLAKLDAVIRITPVTP
jgi:hypothetical protein